MSLIDKLGAGPVPKPGICGTRGWINSLSPEEQKSVQDALASDRWRTSDLYTVFAEAGYSMKYNALNSHRRGACSCGTN